MAKRLWDKGEDVNQQMLHYTVGSDPLMDLNLVRWDAMASAAHAKMLASIGIFSAEESKRVVGLLKQVVKLSDEGSFQIADELEDCHTAIELFLVEKAGEAGKKINTGRSRNDQVITAMRLYLRQAVITILSQTLGCVDTFAGRYAEIGKVPMPGYTHFQRAMPSSFGMWLHAFMESLLDVVREGRALLDLLDANPLGAAAGFSAPLPLNREMTAELLGFRRVQRSPIDIQNSRGRYETRFIRWCSDVGAVFEKISWDLILFCTSEYGFVRLPNDLTTGSSIMPQKRNPDVLELTRARASRLRGLASEITWITAKLPSNYHRDYQLTKEPVFRAAADLLEMCPMMERVIATFSLNVDALKQAMTPDVYATYDAYKNVREGMPFRDAYRKTADAIKAGALDIEGLKGDFAIVAEQTEKAFNAAVAELSAQKAAVETEQNRLQLVEERLWG